ncbi:TolC family protein [Ferrovum sp.]|uniref:TolC family protein n=1 Tax=Ferrovum sp. TaxID=2609467 RepID=UPI002619A828|nr:TolC family protein [Ferrovum sp.]
MRHRYGYLGFLALLAGVIPLPSSAIDLGEAIALAEKNDPGLASAQANRDAAFENIAIAKSKLLPQVSFQGMFEKMQYGLSQQQPIAGGGTSSAYYMMNAYNNQFTVHQALYHPRDQIGLDLGKQQAVYGEAKLAAARIDLWLRTTNAWLDVLVAVENRRLYVDTVKTTEIAADQAEKRFKAGDGTREIVIEAQAQHELAKSELTEATITLHAKEQAFQLLVGQLPEDLSNGHLPNYEQIRMGISSKEDLQQLVRDVNPDILAAEAAKVVNQKRAEQAHADRLPQVDLIASKTWAQNDTIFTINQTYNMLAAGVQMTVPLYAGGGLVATQRQSEYSARASEEDLRAEQLKHTSQVEMDWASAEASIERAHSAKVLWEAAREQKKAAEMGVPSGVRTWADVAQADTLMARRGADFISYAAGVLRSQAHLLSSLPVTENIWEPWVAQLSLLSK